MSQERPFDLYAFRYKMAKADWIKEIHIFGSRRYLANASYGSDIDLLIIPSRKVPTDALSKMLKTGRFLSFGCHFAAFCQSAIGEVDAPAIEKFVAGRNGNEHRRVTVLCDADGCGSLRSSSRQVILLRGAAVTAQPVDEATSGVPF